MIVTDDVEAFVAAMGIEPANPPPAPLLPLSGPSIGGIEVRESKYIPAGCYAVIDGRMGMHEYVPGALERAGLRRPRGER